MLAGQSLDTLLLPVVNVLGGQSLNDDALARKSPMPKLLHPTPEDDP